MRLLSTWMDYLTSGRIRADLGQGVVLDTDTFRQRDTGWRDITTTAGANITAGRVYVRRSGWLVELFLDGVTVASTATGRVVLFALPDGWRPRFPLYASTVKFWTADIAEAFSISPTTGSVLFESLVSGQVLRGSVVFHTDNALPSAMPGIAA